MWSVVWVLNVMCNGMRGVWGMRCAVCWMLCVCDQLLYVVWCQVCVVWHVWFAVGCGVGVVCVCWYRLCVVCCVLCGMWCALCSLLCVSDECRRARVGT